MATLSEEMDDRVVAAVTTTHPDPDLLETLLRRLVFGTVVPPPPPKPVPSVLEQLLQRLLTEAQAPRPTPPAQAGHSDIESLLIRVTESTTRVSNGARPQDPGGGEVQLAAFRDVAVAQPILQPTLQPASVMVVTGELQRDVWTGLESGPFRR